MIRVFVADNHAIVREGVCCLLSRTNDIECVGHAGVGSAVLDEVSSAKCDVLLLEYFIPGGGEALLQRVKSLCPDLPVIVFSTLPEDRYAIQLLKVGASAYLKKERSAGELLDAIRKVAVGGKYITQALAQQLLEHNPKDDGPPHQSLTARENQIFMLLLEGKQPRSIGDELHVSASTISTHIRRVKQKLGVVSIVGMVKYAYRVGLLHT